mmetsp:Transcript_126445/g.369446  ORF Transcript_126445/g.369446 Transcript_126445/m.369446 type:complete len:663 (-) Transcript_126445:71-2059(-)
MSKKIASPNDSLQQSTREPSQRSGEVTSLDTISFSSSKRFLSAGAQIGGGDYKLYMMDHLTRMHVDIEATTRKLELEQRRLARLDKDLAVVEEEYEKKRQRYKLFQSQDDAVQHKEAENRQLEKRLIKAKADLNKGTSENEQLREEINRLRRERELLNSVFKQLERGIAGNRRGMDRLKANMNEEKMHDEDAKQRSKALGRLMDRERMQFQRDTEKLRVEVGELSEIEKERERPRAPERTLEGPTTARGRNRRAYMVADEEEAFSEQSMHRRILKLSFLNTIQRRHIKQHQKNIEVFEQAFATIRSSTGISDIEEIVKIFIILEQRNFSLLTYVNQLNQDIEYVYKRNRELEEQMQNHKREELESTARKETALNDVSVQISKTKVSTQEKAKMIKEAEGALEECRPLIWNIVKFLNQEIPGLVRQAFEGDAPPMKTSAPDEGEENLNMYLMYIQEAISQFKVCLSQDVKPTGQPPRAGASRPGHVEAQRGGGPKIPSDLPSAHVGGDDSDDDPETGLGDRPWNRSELRERAQANIQRRRKKRGEGGARPAHEERGRLEATDESSPAAASAPAEAARKDAGPPPPVTSKDNTASSVTSRESGGDSGSGGNVGGSAVPRSPGTSGKPTATDASSSSPREGEPSKDDDATQGKAWWSGQGKEKRK